ncbi:MAG: SMC family ATPase [Nitrososphaeria archaeon]|nr:SMC family ATPase [Nitrososphaeria archaeon]
MIMKSLRLKNIRSYIDETIEFPLGVTLFEGDIGSGKSTILMAIEFALFGLGSEKGDALLRIGAKEGSVTLKFEVDGEEYEVYRSLARKGKGVNQVEGYIKTKEGTLHLSASEMKERILEILNFNEPPNPKAQSVIYRYAVFTPQEEMKAILLMPSDARLQTLRKAFRIEDYQIAIDNASSLANLIKEKSIELSSQASDLEEKLNMRKLKEDKIREDTKILEQFLEKERELDERLKELKKEADLFKERKEKLSKVEGEIPHLKNKIEDKNKRISELQQEIDKLEKEIKEEIQPSIDELKGKEKPTEKTEEALKEELEKMENLKETLMEKRASVQTKIKDYESIEKSKICPTCDRPADPKEFSEKIRQKREERDKISLEVVCCKEKINEIKDLLEKLKEYNRAQNELQRLINQLNRNREKIEKYNEKIKDLSKEADEAEKRLKVAEKEFDELKEVSEKINELDKEIEKVGTELIEVRKNVSSTKTKLQMLESEVEDLNQEIGQKEKQRKLAENLNEYYIWLKDFFVPTLDNIEKHVMLSINQEFNQHFQKWFSMLVEDPGKEARIDEDFTPIVEQDGYEQNILYLSGGEKTSVALAYRLALNSIVQKVSAGMKSNLLILDEPTDGFSKEQLFKVRDILNEIKCPQVIIVSHERELESFADHVLRVEKTQGVSKISS